jgi:hypothetical protein
MDTSVTRIMDLPIDNAAITANTNKPLQTSPTTYTTINPHPNPYGHPPPSVPAPPAPEFQGNGGGGGYVYPPSQPTYSGQGQPGYPGQQPQQQQLPPRDFPKNQDFYNLDEKIQANYIPPSPPLNNDFIRKYEEEKEKEWKKNVEKKRKSNRIDDVIEKTQIPIIVAIIFFIFNLPIVNNLIFQRLAFLAIYNTDGNFNIYGLILKSVLFGIMFHIFTYIVELLSNF